MILLDSNSLMHRAYHALPGLSNGKGQFTGAIYGFLNILFKLLEQEKPTHVAAVFDVSKKTFRNDIYPEYKATRKPTDPELAMQFEPIKKILKMLNVATVELQGYEADDIVGTLSKKFDVPTVIVTGDRDSFQLVSDSTTIMWTKVGISSVERVDLKYLNDLGFESTEQFIDYKALRGDTSDNIPGIKGVGEKTALDLLKKFNSLDGVFENADGIGGKIGEKIRDGKADAYMSKKLATIDTDVPVDVSLDDLKINDNYSPELAEYLTELQMTTILKKLNFETAKKEVKIVDVDFEEFKKIISDAKEFSFYEGDFLSVSIDGETEYRIEIKKELFSDGTDLVEALNAVFSTNARIILFDAKKYFVDGFQFDDYFDVMISSHIVYGSEPIKNVQQVFERENLSAGSAALFEIYARHLKIATENKENEVLEAEFRLAKVLSDMQKRGIGVDTDVLNFLEADYSKTLSLISKKIEEITGSGVNVASPKQTATLLFEQLNLPHGKKNKSGSYSVDEETLSELVGYHPVVALILQYRRIAKLLSTYVTGMKTAVKNGRVHTEFNQTVTTTGRLSSTNPNLQNIPVRGEDSKKIKSAFVAKPGFVLLSCDYSQIELRLLAHFSGEEKLISAYENGADIHSETASQIFGVPIDKVTSEQRKAAKAVNFGIVYGISDFGLARDVGISVKRAKDYIENYYNTYPKVKEYLSESVDFARKNGFAVTYLGRRRNISGINSPKYLERSQNERFAMNTPLQGSAADIVKLAMIKIEKALEDKKSKMLIQIHDELIFEVAKDEFEEVLKIVKDVMENVVKLKVPLIVDAEWGDSWGKFDD